MEKKYNLLTPKQRKAARVAEIALQEPVRIVGYLRFMPCGNVDGPHRSISAEQKASGAWSELMTVFQHGRIMEETAEAQSAAEAQAIAMLQAEIKALGVECEGLDRAMTRHKKAGDKIYKELTATLKQRDAARAEVVYLKAKHARITEALRRSADAEAAELRAQLAQQQVLGWKLVPVEPTPEMVSAAEEAHMPFGDMDIALLMAMLAAPAPVQAEPASPWVAVSERLPKKGEDVQVYCDTSGEQMVAFSLGDGRFQFAVDLHGDVIACRPTHWMPLPAAPAPGKREGE